MLCIVFCVTVFTDVLLLCLLMVCIVVSTHEQVDRLTDDSETITNSWFVPHSEIAVIIILIVFLDSCRSYYQTAVSVNLLQQSSEAPYWIPVRILHYITLHSNY